jgi:hypothetical protein
MEATEYAPGTVVVDVIDPTTSELRWRGKARAPVSNDEPAYELDLERTVTAILSTFPHAQPLIGQAR